MAELTQEVQVAVGQVMDVADRARAIGLAHAGDRRISTREVRELMEMKRQLAEALEVIVAHLGNDGLKVWEKEL
jgi:glutamine synthetase type III